jgi:YVTN family beta-propeller protein
MPGDGQARLKQLSRKTMMRTFALCAAAMAVLLVPSKDLLCQANAASGAVLPSGRIITPQGRWTPLAPFPFSLAVRPDGDQIVAPSVGWPFSLNIINHPGSDREQVERIPEGHENDPDVQVLAGVAYSHDGKLLYVATGDSGAVDVYATDTWKREQHISLDGTVAGKEFKESFAGTLMLAPDGRYLYVLDQGNWRVVVIDTQQNAKVAYAPTGSNPIALAVSPDSHKVYVANSGLFEYQPIGGADANRPLDTGLKFPPFGYPSRAAREGAVVDGHKVPGLGDENDARGSSLWTIDVSDAVAPRVTARLRLGAKIAATKHGVVGGAAPSAVLAAEDRVYVALAHEDSVAVVSTDGTAVKQEIALTPFSGARYADRQGRPLRGLEPSGFALRGDRLFVTESGINAVAVVDTAEGKVVGHIPVGWNPSAVEVSRDGHTLYVTNAKGKGAGPNGGAKVDPDEPHYVGELEYGSLSEIALSPEPDYAALTRQAIADNEAAVAPGGGHVPRLKHVFYIVRENRTYDEILGDVMGANGDPKLARFGMHGWAEEDASAKDLRVTPNAHALVARFGTSDNFFLDSDVSADGHRWAVGAAPTPWFNLAWTSGYGGRRTGNAASSAPGRRALGGGADAPMPEDEPEFGTLWEHVAGSGLGVLNYGESLEVEGNDEMHGSEPEGQRLFLNSPVPQPVFESTDRKYPTFNLGIPDQYRFAEFKRDFVRRLSQNSIPSLIVIRLPDDHMMRARPDDGYPYRASYVADNDLALGKIVELISHSAIWKDSAIFVTEDDAQGGVDHVDAHRSVLLAMSPYSKRGAIAHRHVSMTSIQKTMYEALGLGSLNLEDALAADLGKMFTDTPDLEPFTAVPSDARVFAPAKAKLAHPKTAAEAAEMLDCDDPRQIAAEFQGRASGRGRASRKDDD